MRSPLLFFFFALRRLLGHASAVQIDASCAKHGACADLALDGEYAHDEHAAGGSHAADAAGRDGGGRFDGDDRGRCVLSSAAVQIHVNDAQSAADRVRRAAATGGATAGGARARPRTAHRHHVGLRRRYRAKTDVGRTFIPAHSGEIEGRGTQLLEGQVFGDE